MKQRLLACLLLVTLSGPALARTVEDRLISGLKAQGYVVLEDGFTWLGRLRIVAENATYHREIVVNPETGEVLRDYVVLLSDIPSKPPRAPQVASEGDSDGASPAGASAAPGVSVAATTEPTVAPQTGASLLAGAATAPSDDLLLADPVLPTVMVAP